MNKNNLITFTSFLLVVLISSSCSKIDGYEPVEDSLLDLPDTPFDYVNLNLPSHFTSNVPGQMLLTSINGTDNTPSDNPITDDGATLGRVRSYNSGMSDFGSN